MKSYFIVIALMLTWMLKVNGSSAQCSIQLLVVDKESSKPITGAAVYLLDDLIGHTDANGEYIFTKAIIGEAYTFTVKPDSYEAKSEKRWAKDNINMSLTPMTLNMLSTLMNMYEEELKQDSPNKKKLENVYARILKGLEMERDLVTKEKFLANKERILNEKEASVKLNMEKRDAEMKPLIKDNYDKLTEDRR